MAGLDGVMIGLVVAIAAGCVVLWGHHAGYIELRNLVGNPVGNPFGNAVDADGPGFGDWLAGVRRTLADAFRQLGGIN